MTRSALEKKFIDYTRYYQSECCYCKKTFYSEIQFSTVCNDCDKKVSVGEITDTYELFGKSCSCENGTIEPVNTITHSVLCDIAEKWLLKRCGVVFKELSTMAYEEPDAIGFRGNASILIECKASRADFLGDKNKIFRKNPELGMGQFRFYMCQKGIIEEKDLPEKWGLIIVNKKGIARQKVGPKGNTFTDFKWCFSERNTINEMAMMYSALRRLQIRGQIPLIYEPMPKKAQ